MVRIVLILSGLVALSMAQYGRVDFETSCAPEVKLSFNQGLSLLYSFEYPATLAAFDQIASSDPHCCMAYFMAASSFTHPIWDFIQDHRLAQTQEYSTKASQCAVANPNVTARERGYIAALAVYANTTDPSVADPAARLQAYSSALKNMVYMPYNGSDENAGILYGLSLLAVGYYSETEPAEGWPHLREAGQIQQHITRWRNPESPGALHYTVHAYDQPAMAWTALDAAYRFENNSCAVPHAVHMPSHIYSDRGIWNRSVLSNVASVNLAFAQSNGTRDQDWYHGSYFLQYAMLQLAMDCDAHAFLTHFQKLSHTSSFATHLEAATRVASHYLVETRSWVAAAEFDLKAFYGLNSSAYGAQYIVRFNFMITAARAILDYPLHRIAAACDVVEAANHTLVSDPSWRKHQMPYWRLSYEMDVRAALAWKAFRGSSFDAGIDAMRQLSAFQNASWSPEAGHLWDANEQLGEMLLVRNQTGDVAMALKAFELARSVYPNRYHSLAGAAKCAALLVDQTKACLYYRELMALTQVQWLPAVAIDGMPNASCPEYHPNRRPELVAAQAFVRDKCG